MFLTSLLNLVRLPLGESGGAIYQILYQKKQQNDERKWNMIDSSFITTLPDTWAINKRFYYASE
jgi:arginine decarboxylase